MLAGATSAGKTAMMLNLVRKMSQNGFKIDIFSLEMTLKQLQNRIISAETEINVGQYRNFKFSENEYLRYRDYVHNKLGELNIRVCDDYDITVEKLSSILKKSDCDIAVIDYLGLINGQENKSSYERMSYISRKLKQIANKTNKPLLVLHQLSRELFSREDKRPRVSDLRDSGKIEQDADMICFVHWPHYFEQSQPPRDYEFIIEKHRNGQSKQIVKLLFDAPTQRIWESVI